MTKKAPESFPLSSDAEIRHALRDELTWTHYRLLLRVEDEKARAWYLTEAADQNWSTHALERQINSLYYERLLMSRDKDPVVEEMREKTVPLAPTAQDFIKDPYVLEFLGLQDSPAATPAGVVSVRSAYRGCRCAQPPANGWQPAGLRSKRREMQA